MILPLYLSFSCLLLSGHAVYVVENRINHEITKTNIAQGGVMEYKLVEKQIASTQHEPKEVMVERGSKKNAQDKYGSVYPIYVTIFLQEMAMSYAASNCQKSPFSCAKIPDKVKRYFVEVGQPDVEELGTFPTTPAFTTILSSFTGPTRHLDMSSKQLSPYALKYNDPEWGKQWEMHDYRTTNIPVMDHNIVPVHDMGYKGKGITIAMIGGGVRDHPDLGTNLVQSKSYDFCRNKPKQYPEYWIEFNGYNYNPNGNYHAGLISMVADNRICGVGIAPGTEIAAYKMTDCEPTQRVRKGMHSHPLSWNHESIHIFCNTWTVTDKMGNAIFPISEDVLKAFYAGIGQGRNGLGSIYVFPSGVNRASSNCASNGYINNIYTITIASANQAGKPASYSDRCSAVFATAYSGDVGMEGLGTIDASGRCATTPSDIAMGATVASGIIALLLDFKASLTYRDVMHIVAMTAEVAPLADNPGTWQRNGRGFWVSSDFGFGLMNAENMVELAENWKNVGSKKTCQLRKKFDDPIIFDHKASKEFTLDGSYCKGASAGISYLEHVELEFTASYHCRGAIAINLTSPAGTNTVILENRIRDYTRDGFVNWNVMSTQYWGENPKGPWTITVSALEIYNVRDANGRLEEFVLKLSGLQDVPGAYLRKYAAFRLPNGQTNLYA